MLKIHSKVSNRTLLVLRDSDEEPVSIDEFILNDKNKEEKECKSPQKNKT